jgi:DNA-binding IclR family transcriptional regulator
VPASPSPSVLRSTRLLAELAARPAEDFTLSQLARRLDIGRASCQTLLLALVEAGLVTRRTNRTYHLGPGLINLGEAARLSLRLPESIATELDALTAEFAVTSLCGKSSGSEIVVVSVNEVHDPFGFTIPLGQRMPLRAPFGCVYVAWEAETEIDLWLDRSEPSLSAKERAQARKSLERVRRRGHSITVRRPGLPPEQRTTRDSTRKSPLIVTEPKVSSMEFPDHADETSEWTIMGVGAPVFDQDDRMLCAVAITGLPTPRRPAEIDRIAQRVQIIADSLTTQIRGAPS